MTAQEYYKKYGINIWASIKENQKNILNDLVLNLFFELLSESMTIAADSNIVTDEELVNIIFELNQKWNQICDLFKKDCHMDILNKDGFINKIKSDSPWLKTQKDKIDNINMQ